MYDGIDIDDRVARGSNCMTHAEIAAGSPGGATDDQVAFLQSRESAVANGATGEFNKMEGANVDLAGAADRSVPFMFLAMSDFSKAMTATSTCGNSTLSLPLRAEAQ